MKDAEAIHQRIESACGFVSRRVKKFVKYQLYAWIGLVFPDVADYVARRNLQSNQSSARSRNE